MREELDADDFVYQLQFRDDVETDIWEVVLEHVQEHWEQVCDCLVLAENWCEAADLSTKSCAHVLRRVSDELLDARHDLVEQGLAIKEAAETRDLPSDSASHFGFCVFQEFDKCWDKIPTDNLFINCFGDLEKSISLTAHTMVSHFHTFSNRSATMYRTLQLLSSNKLLRAVRRMP